MYKEEETYSHPSFGILRFSRISGNSGYLFGSSAQPNNFIEMTLQSAEYIRNLADDRAFPKSKDLVRVKMSPAQFAELITSLNYSSGTPVTIEVLDGKAVPQAQNVESRKSCTGRLFKERMKQFGEKVCSNVARAEEIIAKKTLSKQDQSELRGIYRQIETEIEQNIPFYQTMFQEQMDKIVVDAKAEVDATIQSTISKAGLKVLKGEFDVHRGIE